ncbi:MAG: outer membrane protein assembly factor BamA [Lewinellaceae bacterium]|nr:outer membrane protein assembly factor BamA [Saprospiraceae bacterium]MCB9314514.1 outer membrane protein assembly factor BamA [Lewinellaceae bacterium]MCB9332523.1 outer membrane protein assembly factor BamA [Lewinellaceae bacterium]
MSMKLPISGLLLVLFSVQLAQAQVQPDSSALPVMSYEAPKDYEIGGIRVTGEQFSDPQALIAISGFRVGDKIRVPGPAITKAVQALWNLRLFTDVQIIKERTAGEVIFLEIVVSERPRYTRHSYTGVKKNKHDDLNAVVTKFIQKGAILTENIKSALRYGMEDYYIEKGFLNAKVEIKELPDERSVNAVKLEFVVKPGKRVKIKDIRFVGNENIKSKTLRKKMKNTARKSKIFKKSKLVENEYEEDKHAIEAYYNTVGFRDARIVSDTTWRTPKGEVMLQINIEEGSRYYFRNITWKGNTIYETQFLNQVLGINKGDIYNQELLNTRLQFSQDGRDISSLYLDNGYLFFRVDPVETSIDNDSIDLELRIFEGPQATIDRVVIKGNDRTHEHVIRRELFTRPGEKFSRSDIIRSQRQIVNLGYFNPESLDINTPVNPDRGTVDIEYTVEEKPSDQLELSAGYQPSTAFTRGGVIGTLGVTFNNFSIRNINKKETWNPLPQGDGQRFSIRGQTSGQNFQSYNASFTEPWLGGKKPNSLTVAGFYNRYAYGFEGSSTYQRLEIIQGSVGFGTRLKWPDDNFVFRANLDIQTLRLNNWTGFRDDQGRLVTQGKYHNYNLGLTLARNSINDPIFPKSGSLLSLTVQATPPYSWFRDAEFYQNESVEKIYNYVEYLKWRIDAEWYTTLVGKLVLKAQAKIGILDQWTDKTGLSPFERFELGGDGLNNQTFGLNGRDIISMRGYETGDIMSPFPGGAGVFNKYTLELRYPISLNPQSTIFVTAFAQGGNAFQDARDFNPFDLRRSAGLGLRVFLPMFGTLGFDYGYGFDKPALINSGAKWSEFAKFNIVLGFEPD